MHILLLEVCQEWSHSKTIFCSPFSLHLQIGEAESWFSGKNVLCFKSILDLVISLHVMWEENNWATASYFSEIIQCAIMAQLLMVYLIFPDKTSKLGFCTEMIETVIKVESRKVRWRLKDNCSFSYFFLFLFTKSSQVFRTMKKKVITIIPFAPLWMIKGKLTIVHQK